ncbi:MAG: type 4a pilus biogenesis protein PilO [Acidobacteriota bacterium]
MKTRSPRELFVPLVAGLAALVVINALVMFGVTRPRLAQARNADQTTANLASRVERAERQVKTLSEKVERLKQNKAELEKFFSDDLSSKTSRLVPIQREIQKIAEQFQVGVSQLNFDHERVKGTDLVRLAVNIPLTGGYNNLRQFVQNVEHSDIFLVIDSMQLQTTERGGALLNLNIRLVSYFIDKPNTAERFTLGS